MSEIKFRAWDKCNLNMFYGQSGFHFEGDGCVYINVIQADFGAYNDPVIMQFTGLLDKNGKEIYEGDIILWGDRGAIKDKTAVNVVVEFRSGCFGISTGEQFHEFWHYGCHLWDRSPITADMWGSLPIDKYFRACFEVIGNIYENPKLLEVTTT